MSVDYCLIGVLNGLTITHRIFGKQTIQNGSLVYRTKGDNIECDIDLEPIFFKDIKGVYIAKSKLLSTILRVITNFYGFLLFIFIPLVSLLISQIISILKLLDKRKGVVRKQ